MHGTTGTIKQPDTIIGFHGGSMKVKDIMIPIHDYLRSESTLKEAVNLLKTARQGEGQFGVIGLPVLNEQGALVGMLSMTDILKAVYPSYMSMMNLGDFTWDGMLESLACQAGDKKVGDLMTRKVITVREDDPLMECVDRILKGNVRKMPVVDKTGKVVGMIYLRDLFFAVTQAMLDESCKLR
jgi:CBS domain-containing protein